MYQIFVIDLKQGKGAEDVGGQVHRVQHGDLDHAVGLGAAAGPVLVTLHLGNTDSYMCIGCWFYSNIFLL